MREILLSRKYIDVMRGKNLTPNVLKTETDGQCTQGFCQYLPVVKRFTNLDTKCIYGLTGRALR